MEQGLISSPSNDYIKRVEKMGVSKLNRHLEALEICKYLHLAIWKSLTRKKLALMRYHNTLLATLLHRCIIPY